MISLVVTMTVDILMNNIITEFFPTVDILVAEAGLETEAMKKDRGDSTAVRSEVLVYFTGSSN